jgi:hypothetical protein
MIMSAAMMTVQRNSVKMNRMIGTVYNLLECNLSTTQYMMVLLRSVKCSVDQVSDQHLTRSEEKPEEEEEAAEHKATILDALKGLEAARKYRLRAHREQKQKTGWLNR